MRPHAQDTHDLLFFEYLIHQAMLNADPPRVGAGELADQFFVWERIPGGSQFVYEDAFKT